MKISYCIGVHNEEKILQANLYTLDKKLKTLLGKDNYEIVVVDNGSTDKSPQILKTIKLKSVKKVFDKTKGYGIAFRQAYKNAKYENVVLSAIDLPFQMSDLKEVLPIWDSYDIIFGSKAHPKSKVTRDTVRRLTSFVYRILLAILFANKIKDPQGSIFFKKSKVKPILKNVTANNSFFSTQLAIYAQKRNLKIAEVPVVLHKDPKDRKSRYSVFRDGTTMLFQIAKEFSKFNKISIRLWLVVFLITVLLSVASFNFGKGLNLYFWRDDWTAFWFLKNDLNFYFSRWILPSRHPGEFLATFPWFYVFGLNHISWQIMGIILKIIASLSVGALTSTLLKSKKVAIASTLLFASYFGGLEGFTWISARLSAYLIIFYTITAIVFTQSLSNKKTSKLFLPLAYAIVFLEPGRSIFFLGLLGLYALLRKSLTKQLVIMFAVTSLLGLLTTAYGRTMLGFKSAELVSPYAEGVLARATTPAALKGFITSLSTLLFGNPVNTRQLLLVLPLLALLLLQKKYWREVIVFALWIVSFYFAAWISDPGVMTPAASRYFTLSAVGAVSLLALAISRLPKVFFILALLVLLVFNLSISRSAVNTEYEIRNAETVKNLLKEQGNSLPDGFSGGVFVVTGQNALRGYVFDWSYGGGLPFALTRNISSPEQIPVGANLEEVAATLCGTRSQKYYLDNYLKLTPEKLTLNKVYAWQVNMNGSLSEVTNKVRAELKDASCENSESKL